VLRIRDDGRGLPEVNGGPRDGGLGLSGMRERALLVGGRLSLFSAPGEGTRVEMTIDR